jgi:hypothetical protein
MGSCTAQWDGVEWFVAQDNCPPGKHCVLPSNESPGPYEGYQMTCPCGPMGEKDVVDRSNSPVSSAC